MIAKVKGIISGIAGRIGSIDRTIGREGGLSVNVQDRRAGSTLVSKKAMTRGGSEARHERVFVYCGCDEEYRGIGKIKQLWVNVYWRARGELNSWKLTNYQTYMKMCLRSMPEKSAFEGFSWIQRYVVVNMTGVAWNEKIVRLVNLNVKRIDGKDVRTYHISLSHAIIEEIPHHIGEVGTVDVKVTLEGSGGFFLVDVYSYSNFQHEEGW